MSGNTSQKVSPNPTVGIKAIFAYALGTAFFFYAFIQRVSPSVMTDELMRDFAVGGAALGVLSATYFYSYALIQLPVGMLMDRFGPRKLMSATALICAAASIWFSVSESLLVASVSRALIGGSVAFAFVGTLTVATTFFAPGRFSLLTGTLLSVGMCGAIVGQAPLRVLLEQVGWRQTFVLLAGFAVVLSVLLYLVVPRRASGIVQQSLPSNTILTGMKDVVTNRQSWWGAGAGFGLSASMLSFAGLWAVPWLTSTKGMSSTVGAGIASMMFVGWAVGAPLMGWLADRLGQRKRVLVVGTIMTLITLIVIFYSGASSPGILSGLFLLNGIAASCMVVCFALVRESNKPEHNATSIGFVNMCVVGSGAVMQPFIGWLLDARWQGAVVEGARVYTASTYAIALLSLVVVVVLAFVCAIMITETKLDTERS